MADEEEFRVVAEMLFGNRSVGTFSTREQADSRIKE